MQQRILGRTGITVSAVGLGTWQLGPDWGGVDDAAALEVLRASVESGVTLFDTADVYGDGQSEQVIGRFLRENPDSGLTVATKMGRRGPQESGEFTLENFRLWADRSRRNLDVDTLDLVQLHCPPTPVFSSDSVYDALDILVSDGVFAHYGVSVETCEEALAAIARPHVASVQIIINAFRLKPLDVVLPAAREAGVAIIARVPLASGLLGGKYSTDTTFAATDHRSYNRDGSAFDVGETFSGVDYNTGVAAARSFAALVEQTMPGTAPSAAAIAWLTAQSGVSIVIPGARNRVQAEANAAAGSIVIPSALDDGVHAIYDEYFRAAIHPRW